MVFLLIFDTDFSCKYGGDPGQKGIKAGEASGSWN